MNTLKSGRRGVSESKSHIDGLSVVMTCPIPLKRSYYDFKDVIRFLGNVKFHFRFT